MGVVFSTGVDTKAIKIKAKELSDSAILLHQDCQYKKSNELFLKVLEERLKLFATAQNKKNLSILYYNIACNYFFLDDLDNTIKYAKKSLVLEDTKKSIKQNSNASNTYLLMGKIYEKHWYSKDATSAYEEAEKLGNPKAAAELIRINKVYTYNKTHPARTFKEPPKMPYTEWVYKIVESSLKESKTEDLPDVFKLAQSKIGNNEEFITRLVGIIKEADNVPIIQSNTSYMRFVSSVLESLIEMPSALNKNKEFITVLADIILKAKNLSFSSDKQKSDYMDFVIKVATSRMSMSEVDYKSRELSQDLYKVAFNNTINKRISSNGRPASEFELPQTQDSPLNTPTLTSPVLLSPQSSFSSRRSSVVSTASTESNFSTDSPSSGAVQPLRSSVGTKKYGQKMSPLILGKSMTSRIGKKPENNKNKTVFYATKGYSAIVKTDKKSQSPILGTVLKL